MSSRIYKLSALVWILVIAFLALAVHEITSSPAPVDANQSEGR
jgi:hypothetical protein